MVSVEWDIEKAKRNWYEEGIEIGEKRGMERGMEKGIEKGMIAAALAMLKEKCDYNFIARMTKLSVERIEEIARQNKLV